MPLYRDMDHVCRRASALETQAARRTRELAEAKAVAGSEDVLAEGEIIDGDTGQALATDGGEVDAIEETDDVEQLHVGDQVSIDGRDAHVPIVRVCEDTAGEYFLDECGETVAEYNDCDPDEDVYQVVFANRTTRDIVGVKRYPYPRSMLTLESPLHGRNEGGEE